jgi:metal-responsive CopG/Arc/MetJ family transcriptional regulator
MPAKPVQISMDTELLRQVDSDPEARAYGRSAFIAAAVEHYLAGKARRRIESRLTAAYAGQADALLEDVAPFVDRQAWPSD